MNDPNFAPPPQPSNEHQERVNGLHATILRRLGPDYDRVKFEQLLVVQGELWKAQDRLRERLESGGITSFDYMSELTLQMKISMAQARNVLGDGDFDILFGAAGRTPDMMIDKDSFFASENELGRL